MKILFSFGFNLKLMILTGDVNLPKGNEINSSVHVDEAQQFGKFQA